MASAFDIGDTVKLTFYVRVDGVLTDATLVVCAATKPDGTTLTPAPTVAHPGLGTYTAVIAPDAAGKWIYKFTATGGGGIAMAVEDGFFDVEVGISTTYYATVGELRDELGAAEDKLNSALLEKAVRTASRSIDEWCRRRFWRDTTVADRTFYVLDEWDSTLAYIDDVATKTGLVVKTDADGDGVFETTWPSTDYSLLPLNADSDGGAYSWNQVKAVNGNQFQYYNWTGRPPLKITAIWGWSQIPEQIREACILKAINYFKRKDAPWGIAGSNEWGLVRITRQDADVIELLKDFVRRSK